MKWEHPVGILGLGLLLFGQYAGLFMSPPERMMGEVARILYVHVPAAWLAMAVFAVSFAAALGFLVTGRRGFDYLVESSCEVGVVMATLLTILGSIFARPTWNVWWTWDPRLTTTAVMIISYVGILILRSVVTDPDRRAVWSAAATLLSSVNLPLVYFSVRLLPSIHQLQSNMRTVDKSMGWVLLLNTVAFTLVCVWFLAQRWRIAQTAGVAELPEPLPAREVLT